MSLAEEPGPPVDRRRVVAWVAGVFVAAVLVVGGAFLLGISQMFAPEGAVAVLPLTGEDGAPVLDPPVPGMLVLFTSDLAAVGEIDMRVRMAASRDGMAMLRRAVQGNNDIRFVLDGSVRVSGTRLAMRLRLADIRAGTELWSDTLEGEAHAIFPLMTEAVRRLAFLIKRNTAFRHGRATPADAEASALAKTLLRAAAWLPDEPGARAWGNANRLHELAEALEPTDAVIAAHLAGRYARGHLEGYTTGETGLERASDLLARAATADATNPEVLLARCYLRQAQRSHEEAVEACQAALARDPGMARAAIEIADAYLELARPDDALRWFRRAAAMPSIGRELRFAQLGTGVAQFLAGDYEQAAHWAGQAVATQPADPVARGWLAALLALSGRPTEARVEAAAFFAMPGDGVRRAGELPRVYLVAPEYDGRNALIQNALAKLRGPGTDAGGQPVR